MNARAGRTGRCRHGFIRGLCTLSLCPHWDGRFNELGNLKVACCSCGGQLLRGYNGGEVTTGRICSTCLGSVRAERERRESQEAWLCVPKAWCL